MSEENWSGGELTDHGLYFSESKPQGIADNITFNNENWDLLQLARSKQATPESIANARNYLLRIGYLDMEDTNTGLDSRMLGAIKRFEYTFNDNTMDLRKVLIESWNQEDNPLEGTIKANTIRIEP